MRVLRRSPSSRGFLLRWTFVLCTVTLGILLQSPASDAVREEDDFADLEDDDFAEFDFDEEEFEMRKEAKKQQQQQQQAPGGEGGGGGGGARQANVEDDFDDEEEEELPAQGRRKPASLDDEGEEAMVEEEEDEDEFAHFADEEEFEGFGDEDGGGGGGGGGSSRRSGASRPPPPKTINIAKVPAHLSNNWENYLLEILMAAGIVVYFLNFFTGKSKNQRVATAWFNTHKALLESNFALVGDDGAKDVDDIENQLVKESEHGFNLWCSGRVGCESMAVDIRLLKRQDLVSVIANLMKPAADQVRRSMANNQLIKVRVCTV